MVKKYSASCHKAKKASIEGDRSIYLLFYKFLEMARFGLLIALMMLFGCSKEVDESSTAIIIEEPEIRDEILVKSILRDTLGKVIPNVKVRMISDTFKLTDESDQDGKIEFVIPSGIENGYIILAKEQFEKLILNFNRLDLVISEEITIINNENITTVDLDISMSDLFHVSGRIVDPFGNPITGMQYELTSQATGSQKTYGKFLTGSEGKFSVAGEKLDNPQSSILRAFLLDDRCLSDLEFSVELLQDENLGTLTFMQEFEDELTVQLNVDDCNNDLIAKAYFTHQVGLGLESQSPGEIDIPFCSSYPSKFIYMGVQNRTATNFDGAFLETDPSSLTYHVNACTPAGDFFQYWQGSNQEVNLDVKYDTTNKVFIDTNGGSSFNFEMEETNFENRNGYEDGSNAFSVRKFTKFKFIDNIDANNNFEYLGQDVFMDIVAEDNDSISGIIMSVGAGPFLKIRFRVQKV